MLQGNKTLIAILGLALILLIAIPAYWYQSVTASTGIEGKVASQLTDQLGRNVTIGSVRVKPTGTIVAENVIIDDEGKILAIAKEVHIKYNVLYFFSNNPLSGLRSIEFHDPEIFVTRTAKSEEWNIVRFFKQVKRTQQTLSLHSSFRIVDGRVTITDMTNAAVVEQVNGELNFNGTSNLSIQAEGMLHNRPVDVLGFIDTKSGAYGIQIDTQGQHLQNMGPWIRQNDIVLKSGTANISMYVLQDQDHSVAYNGELELFDGAMEVNKLGNIDRISGRISVTSESLFANNLRLNVNGEPLTATGSIAISGSEPFLDLMLTSSGMELKNVLPEQNIPLSGKAKFAFRVQGTVRDLSGSGVFELAEGAINNVAVRQVKTKIAYRNGWVDIQELQGYALGGEITGQAVVKLDKIPVYSAFLNVSGVTPPSDAFSGNITASLYITGSGDNIVSSIWGAGQIVNGTVRNVPFELADVGFYWSNAELRLDYLRMNMGSGIVVASGIGSDRNLDFSIRADGIPLERLQSLIANVQISGTGQIRGRVQGTYQTPIFTGEFEMFKGQILQQPFDSATGQVTITAQKLTLQNVKTLAKNTTHIVEGEIQLTPVVTADLRIKSSNAALEDILKLVKSKEQVSGVVDNDILLRGPLDNLSIEGRAIVRRIEYKGQRFERVQGSYSYKDGSLIISEGLLTMGRSTMDFSGMMNAHKELDFAFRARNIYLEELKSLSLPYGLSGKAELNGTIAGTLQNPIIAGQITAFDAVINGQKFGTLTGNMHYENGQLSVPEMKLTDGNACYQFLGNINFNSPATIEGALSAREGQVNQLLALLGYPIAHCQGTVTADLVLSGSLARPDARGQLLISNGKVKGYAVDKVEIDAISQNGVVTINNLELIQGQGFLRAQGVWMMDGAIAMEVGGKNLDAGFISALLPKPQPVRGTISFTAQVSGTTQAPQAATSIEIKNGSWANAEFDALYALILLDRDILKVNQVMLSKGPYRASAYGTIPLAALTKEGREDPNSPTAMDLKVRLDQADLSILPLLSQEVAWAVGQTQGEVRVGGNLYQPYVFGNFSVKDGTIKLRSATTPIEHANINVVFEADQIRLETFNGNVGGGTYEGSGHATLKGFSLENLNFNLKLDTLYVNSKYYVGPIQGDFTLESGRNMPHLKGNLVLENAQIMPPVFWPEVGGSVPAMRLDVEIQANKNVRLHNPSLYDMYIQGKVKAQGTLREPVTSGRLTVTRGSLQYLNTTFKISEGVADFNQFDQAHGSFLNDIHKQIFTAG